MVVKQLKVYTILVTNLRTKETKVSQEAYDTLAKAWKFCQERTNMQSVNGWVYYDEDKYRYQIVEVTVK